MLQACDKAIASRVPTTFSGAAAGDYSFAFSGLQVGLVIPFPLFPELAVSIGFFLTQLAFSKNGAIDPAVYPNLGVNSEFWTPA